jgi:hypothetical protein
LFCRAVDATFSTIAGGTVYSRVDGRDSRDFFSKRVLHGDPHHALANASLRSLIQEKVIYECATRFHFRVLKNLGSHVQLMV